MSKAAEEWSAVVHAGTADIPATEARRGMQGACKNDAGDGSADWDGQHVQVLRIEWRCTCHL